LARLCIAIHGVRGEIEFGSRQRCLVCHRGYRRPHCRCSL
jgi:hypothetical protein